ncbi:gamma-aminobutyric acid receptor-associated protein-like 2 isoform X5 [Takifugu rubripes]|uniref:gamma-aminobutyric acid receptor-associated protein-like 2 isoform X5 n=1 Tax=Takifugu rubripes TaxID=31033 RepID=UPI001145B4C8|nr:gamma-aminobutyric acid receptor-associated protein-like 2 isoform X5 [Takifugu rubripes]
MASGLKKTSQLNTTILHTLKASYLSHRPDTENMKLKFKEEHYLGQWPSSSISYTHHHQRHPCSCLWTRCRLGLENRCMRSTEIRNKYPDRVPVTLEKVPRSNIMDVDRREYLLPTDLTVAQFMYIIRKRISLPSEAPMFLFVDQVLPTTSATMGALYEESKDEDGFLYVAYSGENTFGFQKGPIQTQP